MRILVHLIKQINVVGVCPSLASLPNGQVDYDSNPDDDGQYPMNASATFSCNDEYVLDGETSTICQDSGNWNQPTPTCIGNKI